MIGLEKLVLPEWACYLVEIGSTMWERKSQMEKGRTGTVVLSI